MKLYCVFGVEYHVSSTLLGIYESYILAVERKQKEDNVSFGYDIVEIEEIELNQDLECE